MHNLLLTKDVAAVIPMRQLQGVMVDALYDQGLITEGQRRYIRNELHCDSPYNAEGSSADK